MKEKKENHVLSVEKPTQNETPAAPAPASPAQTEEIPSSIVLFKEILTSVNPKDLEKMETLGFPIKRLIALMGTMTFEINAIAENMPNVVKSKMAEAIQEAQAKQRAEYEAAVKANPQASQGGGGYGQVLSLIEKFAGGGGGGMDEDMKKLYMDSMRSNIEFTKAVQNAVVSKIASKAITEVV